MLLNLSVRCRPALGQLFFSLPFRAVIKRTSSVVSYGHFWFTLSIGLALALNGWATTFTVTSTADAGAGTLRQALLNANADPSATANSPHLITITATGIISLQAPFLVITNHLTIQGPGQANLTISGGNSTRIFWIQNGTITIRDLTLANGLAQGGVGSGGGMGAGGAIFMHEGRQDPANATDVLAGSIDLRLVNVALTGNSAQGGSGDFNAGGGGMGGMGGNGSQGGGGGILGNGASSIQGGGGGSVTDATSITGGANGGINIFGSGGNAGSPGDNGGFGGGGGLSNVANSGPGGNGGLGGGGGSGADRGAGASMPQAGGNGGFGGGGATGGVNGTRGGNGGNGGFGGGGARSTFIGVAGSGGFGAGSDGGGGLGGGGAIFVASGILQMTNVSFMNNSATGGTSTNDNDGKGYGGAIFIFNKADNGGNAAPGTTHDPSVSACGVSFSGNTASDQANQAGSNDANQYGAITNNALAITQQPTSSSTVALFSSVRVPVGISGSPTSLQWYQSGPSGGATIVSGQTSATLTLTNVQTAQSGSYSLVITNACNSVTTTAFSLSVTTQPIRYVRAGGSGDGSSWATASGDLQAMINAEGVQQVWVAQGTYKPTSTTARDISFSMKNWVAIYGGFVGNEAALTERSPASYTTVLSGDIGAVSDATDNSYNVINNPPGLTQTAVLDGVVITGGNASDASGGGMYNENSSPSLLNCIFLANTATTGGGMYNLTSSPSLINCSFLNNTATLGGGMDNNSSSPTLLNCSFLNNTAGLTGGGAIHNFRGTLSMTNCVVFGSDGSNTFRNPGGGRLTASYSLFEATVTGYTSGPGNLTTTTSPFVGTATTQLAAGSPAINAGNSLSYTAAGGPATDLGGNVRIQNGTIDMGAYELGLPTDLTPVVYARTFQTGGETTLSLVVDVFEINIAPTTAPLTVRITKDAKVALSFDNSLSSVGGRSVQNSAWSFDATQPGYYQLSTSQPMTGGAVRSVGLTGRLSPGGTAGMISLSATVAGGGEDNLANNTDADKIEYFQQ
ncbi:choice-of-anchor Q domain-containing protein [Spirosoma koreense]